MSLLSNHCLKVKTKTYTKSSYGFFHYENPSLHTQNFSIKESCSVFKSGNEHVFINTSEKSASNNNNLSRLATISDGSEEVRIAPIKKENKGADQDFWWIADGEDGSKGYQLKERDLIKVGDIMLRVHKIKTAGNSASNRLDTSYKSTILNFIRDQRDALLVESKKDDSLAKKNPNQSSANSMNSSGILCKICLSSQVEKNDPLITPCKCTGSMKHVHLRCIQHWMKSKLTTVNEGSGQVTTMCWRNLQCELCKSKLPCYLNYNREQVSLIPFENIPRVSSYAVIESFSREEGSLGMHFVDLTSNKKLIIGSGAQSDIKLSDFSVSETHAFLTVFQGKLFVKDNLSKFGTKVLQKGPVILTDENSQTPWIQCGHMLFKFILKKPWIAFLPCVGSVFNNKSRALPNSFKNVVETKRTTHTSSS